MNLKLFPLMLAISHLPFPPVLGQVQLRFPFIGRQRTCRPHTPLPVDDSHDISVCRREVAAARQFKDRDADKRTPEIVVDHGYLLETHSVTSQDGYITTIYRVPGGRRSPRRDGKPSVLLFHGLGSVSDSWFSQPSNKNLVFKLVDAGYDVWLPDGRGSDNSQRHTRLNADRDLAYWDFSFHEIGIYDLPKMVDLILERSGNRKIFYIAHSQGGTAYLIGASEVPGLNEKIHASFLMAPAAYLGQAYIRSFTMWLPLVYTPLENIIQRMFRGHIDLRTPSRLLDFLGIDVIDICSVRVSQCDLCDTAFFALFDFNPHQANYTNTPNVLRAINTGSVKAFIHFGQNILSCQFRKYDYGSIQNLRRYGTAQPPSYPLRNITAPLHIYHGEQDSFISPPDIRRLANDLRPETLKEVHRVSDITYDHIDFVAARDADTLVYDRIINSMKGYL